MAQRSPPRSAARPRHAHFRGRRVTRTPALRLLAAAAAATAACGAGDSSATARVVVRDSAGVRIVESAAPAWSAGEEWRVEPEPALEIGTLEGDPAYQFHRIGGVDLLPDGAVLVLDAGSAQLRRYGPDGRHLWARRYLPDHESASPGAWDVFAPGGAYLGIVRTPPGLDLAAIRGARAAGIVRDELGVERVRVHRLARDGRTAP